MTVTSSLCLGACIFAFEGCLILSEPFFLVIVSSDWMTVQIYEKLFLWTYSLKLESVLRLKRLTHVASLINETYFATYKLRMNL